MPKTTHPAADARRPRRDAAPTPAESFLPSSLDSLLEGVQVVGRDWRYLYVNAQAAAHGRSTPERLLGRTMMQCYPGIEETDVFHVLERVMTKRREERLRNEFTYPDGRRGWFELRICPAPEGICILSYDVTDAEKTKSALSQRDEELRAAMETLRVNDERTRFAMAAARMGVWELREDAGALWWSETMEDVCRIARGQWPKTWEAFAAHVHPDDVVVLREALAQARDTQEAFTIVFRFTPPDGRPLWLQGSGRFVYDSAGRPLRLLGVGIDVTERRLIEAQLRQAQKTEAIGRLAGGVAHDFNNLLTVITGFGELVAATLPENDPRRQDLGEVLAAASRAQGLTRQLLAFSRKQVMQPAIVPLNGIVSAIERLIARSLGEDIALHVRLAPDVGCVFADVHQIEQALLNLAINARDAMPSGGVLTIETTVQDFPDTYTTRDFTLPAGRYAVLTVTDTGTGMDEDTRSRIFEPFFTTKGARGTGLGLPSVQGSILQQGGFINVYSEPGLGARFNIYLPRREESGALAQATAHDAPPRGNERILVVEDDVAVRSLLARLLGQLGYRTIVAETPEEAWRVAATETDIDLVVSDVIMPQMSGLDLMARIRKTRPEMRALFVSGYSEQTLAHFSISTPATSLLPKPFDVRSLAARVRQALDDAPPPIP